MEKNRLIDAINGFQKAVEENNNLFKEVENLLMDRASYIQFEFHISNNPLIYKIEWSRTPQGKYRLSMQYKDNQGALLTYPCVECPLDIRIKASRYLQQFVDAYAVYLEDQMSKIILGDM